MSSRAWPLSLRAMFSRLIHKAACALCSLLRLSDTPPGGGGGGGRDRAWWTRWRAPGGVQLLAALRVRARVLSGRALVPLGRTRGRGVAALLRKLPISLLEDLPGGSVQGLCPVDPPPARRERGLRFTPPRSRQHCLRSVCLLIPAASRARAGARPGGLARQQDAVCLSMRWAGLCAGLAGPRLLCGERDRAVHSH